MNSGNGADLEIIPREDYLRWLRGFRDKPIVKVVTGLRRSGKSTDDYSWALKLSDAERLSIADRLLRDLWTAAHGQPYPLMDRTVVRLSKV